MFILMCMGLKDTIESKEIKVVGETWGVGGHLCLIKASN